MGHFGGGRGTWRVVWKETVKHVLHKKKETKTTNPEIAAGRELGEQVEMQRWKTAMGGEDCRAGLVNIGLLWSRIFYIILSHF